MNLCKHNLETSLCFVCNGRQARVRTAAVHTLEMMQVKGIFTGKEKSVPREGSDLDIAIRRATRQDGPSIMAV